MGYLSERPINLSVCVKRIAISRGEGCHVNIFVIENLSMVAPLCVWRIHLSVMVCEDDRFMLLSCKNARKTNEPSYLKSFLRNELLERRELNENEDESALAEN